MQGFGYKFHYYVNSECPTQTNLKKDEEAFRKMKQGKSSNKPPDAGDQKSLVSVKYALYSLTIGAPTEEWGEPPSTGLMLCETSTQEVIHTERINDNIKKGNTSIMHVGDTILNATTETRINENWRHLNN